MKKINKVPVVLAGLLIAALFAFEASAAEALADAEALHGLRAAKGVFMIDVKDPGRMAHVLKVIEETGTGMSRQGVTPKLVVVIVGPGVAFLTKDRRGIPYLDEAAVTHIQEELRKLDGMGVRTEACGVALDGMDVDPGDVISQVHPVGNGYISAIGYQDQGYRLVPVY